MTADIGPGRHTRVRRLPEKARYDEATIFSILDAAPYCHVATVVDGRALALPTLHMRHGRTLYLHGSQSNAVLRSVLDSGHANVTATIYDGLRVARSGFESSASYRSAVIFGPAREVARDEAAPLLADFVDAVIPGRGSEVRPMTARETRLTLVVAVEIAEASAKISAGPTDDDEDDRNLAIWSGVVPARLVYETPVPSVDGAMEHVEIPVPPSVRALLPGGDSETVRRVVAQVTDIVPINHREAVSRQSLLDRARWGDDPFAESGSPWHITASAFVISPRGVILHKHRILGIWVQPGGHVDPGEEPETAAQRETLEETGLVTRPWGSGSVFHVDVHAGPRGHTHFDVRYILWNDGDDPRPGPGESEEVAWFDFASAVERAEPALRPALEALARRVTTAERGTLDT